MKILITGQNSYIGTSFETWAKQQNPDWVIDTIDVRGDDWKTTSFSEYDTVINVAGIAHVKETKENKNLYYKVNRDLAIELASKAKYDNVKQYIFLSSMSVYGLEVGEITFSTPCFPKSAYGDSKLQAETGLQNLVSDDFIVSVLRPPMVYGPGCPGNFAKLEKLAEITPIFPKLNNKRSVIHIDVLCSAFCRIIDKPESRLYFPQDQEFFNSYLYVKTIVEQKNRIVLFVPWFNKLIRNLPFSVFRKVFGNLYYTNMEIEGNS